MINTDASVLKILSPSDVTLINEKHSQIELYAENTLIDFQEFTGTILIRAKDCSFPKLENLNGDLSIDAHNAVLPKLKSIEGNCNIHYNSAILPELKTVKGNLKVTQDFTFQKLEKVGCDFIKKGNCITAKPITVSKGNVVKISSQEEADNLPTDGYFSLEINGPNISIPHTEIFGNVIINRNEVRFPNLKFIGRKLLIGHHQNCNSLEPINNIFFPVLEYVNDNCTLHVNRAYFNSLEEINGKLTIYNAKVDFNSLKYVRSLLFHRRNEVILNKLEIIDGDYTIFQNYGDDLYNFKKLVKITKNCNDERFTAPFLEYIGGNISLSKETHFKFPQIKKIDGILTIRGEVQLPSIEFIKSLVFHGAESNFKAKNLRVVENALFNEDVSFFKEDKVLTTFFNLNNSIYLSKEKVFISRFGFGFNFGFQNQISIKTFISILKMRHSSYQNFVTRELKNEWNSFENNHFEDIINTIEKRWEKTKPMTFDKFFTFENRNIRLFCFNYLGVATLMEKLEAKRIKTAGIQLNYFKYDENGTKISFKKDNIFEIYEAERDKLQDLRSWRSGEKIYAVKCWCTSTNNEHWLWIEDQYKDDPLRAIASTFRIHENVIPHIKCLKRQGDILICEMKKQVIPEGQIRPLTKDEYFNLLEVET